VRLIIIWVALFISANTYGAVDIDRPCETWLYSQIFSVLEDGGDFEGNAMGLMVIRLLLEVDPEFTAMLISTAGTNESATFFIGQSITANCTADKSARKVALEAIAEGRKLLK